MMMNTSITLVIMLIVSISHFSHAFSSIPGRFNKVNLIRQQHGVRSMTAVLDVLAGISLVNQLSSASINPSYLSRSALSTSSITVAVTETKQGMYKEYTIDKVDDSALDEIKRTYKTAEETDDSKNKYWAILGVLVAGSFVIPMVQYYWYVAEED